MQLQLLKIQATNDETALLSDDGISASCKPHNEAGQMSDTFWDADERDFAYVRDILTSLCLLVLKFLSSNFTIHLSY